MLIVGLTGGIASGKSTVAALLVGEGAFLIDTDILSRQVVEPGTPGWHEVVECFGREILRSDGTIDRTRLGDIVFADQEKRVKLEALIHPRIMVEKNARLAEIAGEHGDAIAVIDMPLLFEVKREDTVDKVLLVYVCAQTQIARLMRRDGLARADAARRISAQMPIEEKVRRAHYVINNEGTPEETARQVRQVFRQIQAAERKARALR
jgi:dephospho-CoA kinase